MTPVSPFESHLYRFLIAVGFTLVQEWADGISLSCKTSNVQNNIVTGATDGGIVVFGSPGSWIHNNTIVNQGAMQLGGINLVDYLPWTGDFTGTVVENNSILGGFATNLTDPSDDEGKNSADAFIKYVLGALSLVICHSLDLLIPGLGLPWDPGPGLVINTATTPREVPS